MRAVLWIAVAFATALNAAGIAEKTAGMTALPGYFPLYWDAHAGKLWLEINKLNTEFLYLNSLPAGMGSNDIGLDRGQIGDSHIVRFERSGPKVLLVQPNYRYRALTDNPVEREAVEESFAQSVLWGFDVAAEDGGRVLVDATNFFLRDVHGVSQILARQKQGTYHLDLSRSAFYLPRTKNFPKNTEVEVTLTLTGENPGRFVEDVTPWPEAITVREHHSFIELPGPGYEPRLFDPRAGLLGIEFANYTAPLGEPVATRYIERHRLIKRDPKAAVSEPVRPLVYYLDAAAPEPVRSALLDGARWWTHAFEAAGFRNAFRVELLPADADPMDIRYNVIQWVHRATRGWSYGATISDPRTGEIIKGQVTLGSLRMRQDYLIAEGLLAPYQEGKPADPRMREMALARLRQLAAHEVGHTLGLAHNFAASVHGQGTSVMDYPPPYVTLDANGAIDLSHAYAVGTGEWDDTAIRWGYGDSTPAERDALLANATARGLVFLSDEDARPAGSASPIAHLWDAGSDPAAELNRVLTVRAAALRNFGPANIRFHAPMATLQDVLVPVYLIHRYQTQAAAKVLGGEYYTYAVRGGSGRPTAPVPAQQQRAALDALLKTIDPATLTLPANIVALIPPPPVGYARTREDFRNRTGPTFDPVGAADSAANITLPLIFNRERMARLAQQHAVDGSMPGAWDTIDRVLKATWYAPALSGAQGSVQRAIAPVALYYLMQLVRDTAAPADVRAVAWNRLHELRRTLANATGNPEWAALCAYAAGRIERFEREPKEVTLPAPLEAPPGQPIGSNDY